jgi:hypothetical protein
MAVIGALISMMSVMPAAAAEGVVTLLGTSAEVPVTTDSVIWYSAETGDKIITVSVTDTDKNVLTTVAGSCTSGFTFECVLLEAAGGGTAYQARHTFLKDPDGDDIPDGLLIRSLQAGTSGFITTGTSATTGAIVLTGNLGAASGGALESIATVILDNTGVTFTTQQRMFARVTATITGMTGDTCDWGPTAVTIKGTAVNPTTMVETLLQSELLFVEGNIANAADTTATFWKAGSSSATIDVKGTCTAGSHDFDIAFTEVGTIAARYDYNTVNTITARTTVTTSAHSAVPIAIDLTETTASSGIFRNEVELTKVLADHNTATPKKIYAVDGALFTVDYKDQVPVKTITKTAYADLKAPTITLVQPANNSYTNITAQTFVVTVTDPASANSKASGLAVADVDNIVTQVLGAGAGTASANLTPLLTATNSFQVSFSQTIATNGVTKWWIATKDQVGNIPIFAGTATTNVKGAGNPAAPTTTPTGPFKINIDTVAATVVGASTKTGGKTTSATANSVTTITHAADTGKTSNVTVNFANGEAGADTGFAYIDESTIVLSEFTIGGAVPASSVTDTLGANILFTMDTALATDAKPKLTYNGTSLKDKSGNLIAKFYGTGSGAVGGGEKTVNDNLAPVISATTNVAIAQKEVTITVTSSEALSTTPTVRTSFTEPNNTAISNLTAVSVTQTDTKTWTAKVTQADNGSQGHFVIVNGTDTANITTIFGDDAPTATPKVDILYFELDYEDPALTFTDAAGATLANSAAIKEGTVWVVAVFDEDEDDQADYNKDNSTTVTINSMTLKLKSAATGTNISTDTSLLFTTDNKSFTLPVTLAKGVYNWKIKGTDAMGNSKEVNSDFTVAAKAAYSLALKPGVNLVSIPGTPEGDGGNIDTMFGSLSVSSVVLYDRVADIAGENPWKTATKDAATGLFVGDISALEAGRAYFVTASSSGTAKVFVTEPSLTLPPTVSIRQGWNAVGYWTIADVATTQMDLYLNSISWSVAYSFDPTPGTGWGVIRPDDANTAGKGVGYLVYATKDGTLTP